MHLLLPPSEAKHSGGRGRPLQDRPAAGPLADTRSRFSASLLELVGRDDAAEALLLPAGVAEAALAANAGHLTGRTLPALLRYAGVVYDGLDYAAMSPVEQRLTARSTWIFSGLRGVVRGDEPVPDYRVPAKAVLPGVGVAGTAWRPVLDGVLPTLLRRGPIVDLRSGDYAAMWRPRGEAAARTVTVRVLSPAPRGGYAVVSYNSKFGKGRLAAALVRRSLGGHPVDGVDGVAAAWLDAGGAGSTTTGEHHIDLYTT